jgi:uncharacterized membrane protein YkgB
MSSQYTDTLPSYPVPASAAGDGPSPAPPRSPRAALETLERRVTVWICRHGVLLTRCALGVVFLWFGALKLVPGLSPAEELAGGTILTLTGGLVEPWLSVPALGVWECLMGLGLVSGRALRLTLLSFFFHMEGQYIVKNLLLIRAAMMIGAAGRQDR